MSIKDLFDKYQDEFLESDRDESLRNKRKDLLVFNMLDILVPGDCDIVSYSGHDEIFLDVNPDELFKCATEEQILKMIRCGLRYCDDTDSFCMFV